jgi:predicted PurR-regulated permease PerM
MQEDGQSLPVIDTTNGPPPTVPLPPGYARRVAVAVLIALALLAVAYLIWRSLGILLEAFAGALLALLLYTLSAWVRRATGLRHGWSLAIVVVVLFACTAGLGWLLASRLSAQLSELTQKLPESLATLRDSLSQHAWGRVLIESTQPAAESIANNFSRITGFASSVGEFLVAVVVILFVGVFGAAEPDVYRRGFLHLVPPDQRRRAGEALDAVAYNLRWWLVGQVILMVLMWITTTLGLWLIGVPLAVALGVIAGLLEIIPYIGPWLSAVPALLIALLLSPFHVFVVGGLYLGLHIVEGYILVPLLQRGVVEMPPALTLVTQVLLGELAGMRGLVVAAPLVVTTVVLLKLLYVEDTLGDQTIDVPGEHPAHRIETGHT